MRRDEIETAGAGAGIIRRSAERKDAFACVGSGISLAMNGASRVRAHPCRSLSRSCPMCLRCEGDDWGNEALSKLPYWKSFAAGRDLPKRDVFRYPAGNGTVACCVSFRVRVSGRRKGTAYYKSFAEFLQGGGRCQPFWPPAARNRTARTHEPAKS